MPTTTETGVASLEVLSPKPRFGNRNLFWMTCLLK